MSEIPGPRPDAGSVTEPVGGDDAPPLPGMFEPLSVTVEARGVESEQNVKPGAPEVCPGECVELSAQARGGVGPYSYSWDQGLPAHAGPHRACPSATTVYSVTLSDQPEMGEFFHGTPDAHAQVTVRVAAACTPDGLPVHETKKLCEARFPVTGSDSVYNLWHSSHLVATDAQGNIVLAGALFGSVSMGPNVWRSESHRGVFLARFDPACKLLWSKHFEGTPELYFDGPSLAVDAQGNIAFSGTTTGAEDLDLGGGPLSVRSANSAGFVVRYKPDGTHAWSKRYDAGASIAFGSVAFDGSSNAILKGAATADASLGGSRLGRWYETENDHVSFLAKLDASGNLVWSIRVNEQTYGFAVGQDGVSYTTGADYESFQGVVVPYVRSYSARGVQGFTHRFDSPASDATLINSEIAVGKPDQLVTLSYRFDPATPGWTRLLDWFDASGKLLRSKEYPVSGELDSTLNGGSLVVDSHGKSLEAFGFTGTLELAGRMLESLGQMDRLVIKRDAQGNELGGISFGTEGNDFGTGLAADLDGNVVVSGLSDFGEGKIEIFLEKHSL